MPLSREQRRLASQFAENRPCRSSAAAAVSRCSYCVRKNENEHERIVIAECPEFDTIIRKSGSGVALEGNAHRSEKRRTWGTEPLFDQREFLVPALAPRQRRPRMNSSIS